MQDNALAPKIPGALHASSERPPGHGAALQRATEALAGAARAPASRTPAYDDSTEDQKIF